MKAFSAASGRRPVASGSASARSRSICRAESTLSKRGFLPKRSSAVPVRRIARVVRAVLIFELFEQRLRRRGLHLRAGAPRHRDLAAPFGAPRRRRDATASACPRSAAHCLRAAARRRPRSRADGRPDRCRASPSRRRRRRGGSRWRDSCSARQLEMKPPSPFAGPSSERTSPLNQKPCSAACVPLAPSRQAHAAVLDFDLLDLEAIRIEAELALRASRASRSAPTPSETSGPTMRNSDARTSPRISEPSASSTWSSRARACGCAARADLDLSERQRRRGQDAHIDRRRRCAPAGRRACVASASKYARCSFQSTKCGPTSAATSARMIATADPEQGRLQSVLRAPSVRIAGPSMPSCPKRFRTLAAIMAANICRCTGKSIKMRRFFRDS